MCCREASLAFLFVSSLESDSVTEAGSIDPVFKRLGYIGAEREREHRPNITF
jgi:hypothetical protein